MLLIGWTIVLVAANAHAQTGSMSYWLMRSEDGHTWCGYRDSAEFRSAAGKLAPTDSASVTYASGKLIQLRLQVSPESGDWIVIDKYTRTNKGFILQRTNLLTQAQLKVIQDTTIRGDSAGPLRTESVTTLAGKKAEDRADVDIPDVPVATDVRKFAFMAIVDEMRTRSIPKLCKRLE